MNKIQIAHEYAIALINSDCEMQFDKFIQLCWNYADAMQAEADKREHKHMFLNGGPCICGVTMRDVANKAGDINNWVEIRGEEEWQPDWSQAPAWAKAWTLNRHGEGVFWSEIPVADHNGYFLKHENYKLKQGLCYLFGYTGNWQDSLRKRPQ